jgi:Hexameric tyrosine-coordinated heme protein (HTHP)
LDALMNSRGRYAREPFGLIEASQVVAMEFATIAAANNYWR